MTKYIFIKEPGILYDMMFLLKLRFNGDQAYEQFKGYSPMYNEDVKFYNLMIAKTADIDDKLLPLFYNKEKTPLLTFMREVWDEISISDTLINNFYNILRDTVRLKKFLLRMYFPEISQDILEEENYTSVKDTVFKSELPNDVKLYLINILLFCESEIEFIITQLKKAQALVEESYQINIRELDRLKEHFADEQNINNICKMLMADLKQFDIVYYTYCTIYISSISSQMHKGNWIALLGIKSEKMIYSYVPSYEIDLYELGRVLYEETRLKILNMLTEKEMYCAEIAKVLGLKNNSTIYHLGMMTKIRLLDTRVEGNRIIYKINNEYLNGVKDFIDKIILKEECNLENKMDKTKD